MSVYNFNYGWKFRLADTFPLKAALEATKDVQGHFFYETDYDDGNWEKVGLPHTYNDKDLFLDRIQDAGSGQKRTFSCYRKQFRLPENQDEGKVFLEFEGVRQSCYLYVNGKLAGYYEAGVAPFGFELTPYVNWEGDNLVAVATDSTSSRNMDYFGAETPNHSEAEPGAFMTSLTVFETIPEAQRGTGYSWNCNDFNPCVGGLSRNVRLHMKPEVYLTLPLYSNLRTKGIYVYGTDYDVDRRSAVIKVEAEVRNESARKRKVSIEVCIMDSEGNKTSCFKGTVAEVEPVDLESRQPVLTVLPKDAYRKIENGFEPVSEEEAAATETESLQVAVINAEAEIRGLRFWSPVDPYLYRVEIKLFVDGRVADTESIMTGFRKVEYIGRKGLFINERKVWLTGYAQRATNEWAAIGCAPDWLKDADAKWIKESNGNHIRFMHVAGAPADIRAYDSYGIVCTQPAGDKEREAFGRQWDQRVELMRDVIIYYRNHPSILFWEAGNNSISREHMREMRLLKERLDHSGGRFMGCRTINTEEVICEAEYVGTMLNRHAAEFIAECMPITETEYLREESPRRVWDDYTPPDYDYDNLWLGKMGRKGPGGDCYDLNAEEFMLCAAKGYEEFFHDRVGGASGRNLYSAAAALCWSDSAQHGRQAYSENARMSGRVDPVRVKKQSFEVFRVMQSPVPAIHIAGHWNYPEEKEDTYRYAVKEFREDAWRKTGGYARRNPKDKTVYVVASYGIAKVELLVNGKREGICDTPEHTFIFAFPHVNVTRRGTILARAYDYDGRMVASDCIETAGEPSCIRLTVHTGEKGFLADGADIAYLDVETVDDEGRICPLCDSRIMFCTEGDVQFLGGYNSGRFMGFGRDDSVIGQNYVYAECGVNRVFLRAGRTPGKVKVTAFMKAEGKNIRASIEFRSVEARTEALEKTLPQRLIPQYAPEPVSVEYPFEAISAADAAKYVPADKQYCKVLVNGQEPDTKGILSIVDHGSVYSPILFILEAMHRSRPDVFGYSCKEGRLKLVTKGHEIIAEVGCTHLLADGEENLMNGQPVLDENGILIAEINAIVPYIEGVQAYYDEKINVFRIQW